MAAVVVREINRELSIETEYTYTPNSLYVDFKCREIVGLGLSESDGSLYMAENEPVDTWESASRYIDGTVKWDGCSHYWFGSKDAGYLHLCSDVVRFAKQAEHLFFRCGELMKEAGVKIEEDEFKRR